MPAARIERYNGEPTIMIDGVPYPPMTMTTSMENGAYLKDLGEAGIKIYYIQTTTRWNHPGDENTPDGITQTVINMKKLLDAVPDAYIMLRLNVSPPMEWVNAHPEEQVTFNDGSHEPVVCSTCGYEKIDGMYSLASEAWKRDAASALEEYFAELRTTPYFDRIIGFFLCAGGTDEWYYPCHMEMKDQGIYADFSEPFRKEFSAFLRKKYKTEEELQRVWKRPDATFDQPIIPNMEERFYVSGAHKAICHGLIAWEQEYLGVTANYDATAPANVGIFVNANEYLHTPDFYDAWCEATANTIVYFANILKKQFPDLLVGAFYGAYGCTHFYNTSTTNGTLTIMDSGLVDFLASPGVYNNREPGGVVAQREMQDSFRIRNMIYICEDDCRTHHCEPRVQREAMGVYTAQDSINTMKRDFARDICEEITGWWFDMGGNWYNDPKLIALMKRQQEVSAYAYSIDRTKKNEIALIFDTESVHYVSQQTCVLVLDHYRSSDLHRIGAPVDYYFHNDMAKPEMDDYKLYVMLNMYYLTEEEREAIYAKARKNHATILWLYAPGFVDVTADRVMDLENIEKTVGMKLGMSTKTTFPYFKVEKTEHPVLKYADRERRYGYIDRVVHNNVWVSASELEPAYMNPGFYIEDDSVTVLGRYCYDGKVSYAMKEMDGFTNVYCCTQVIRSELLASLAEYAGCHLFTHNDDVVFANENFVTLHAKETGTRRVYFKKPCSPYEVYEKKYYGQNVEYIDVEMYMGETKMWCIKGEC